QPFSNWVLPDVLDRFPQALVPSEDVVEGFVLPHGASSSRELIDAARRRPLDSSQDFGECESPAFGVSQGCEQQVHVIGHDHYCVHLYYLAVVMQTMLKGQGSGEGREPEGN